NMVMLALAASFAAKHGANVLVGGWHQEDYSGYPDCRDVFLKSMQLAINEALGRDQYGDDSFWIYAPLIDEGKDDIVALARGNDVPLEFTWSCYDPVVTQSKARLACGRCDACQLRIRGFRAAGWIDPAPY